MENSVQHYKEIAQSFIHAADTISRGDGDWSMMRALVAPTFRLHTPGESEPVDFDGFIKMSSGFMKGFPGFRHEVQFQVGESDKVVNYIMWHGVHTGVFQGVAPTQREATMAIINIMRFEADKIAEYWRLSDIASLMRQITQGP